MSETIEAIDDLVAEGFPFAGVVANAVYEPLFDEADAEALAGVDQRGAASAAAAAARSRLARTADQREQLDRVRPCLAELPFLFERRLDIPAVASLGMRLEGL